MLLRWLAIGAAAAFAPRTRPPPRQSALHAETQAPSWKALRPRPGDVERLETHLVDLAAAATDEVDAHRNAAQRRAAELQRARSDHEAQASNAQRRIAALEREPSESLGFSPTIVCWLRPALLY